MELDLNQEPLDQTRTPARGFDSVLNELESAHEHIIERIRHLEAVTYRARQRQRWRQSHNHTPVQIIANNTEGLTTSDVLEEDMVHQGEGGNPVQERAERERAAKRSSSYLVARALEMDIVTDTKKAESSNNGSFFDCNICLDMARDPILTCCGHLFCWPCFYWLSHSYSNARECPVCRGEVTEADIIPIYGNATISSSHELELKEAGLRVPPRPNARRIESFRQQLISRGASSAIQERIQQFSNVIGGIGERVRLGSLEPADDRTHLLANQSRTSQSRALSSIETENNQHPRSHQVSRLLMQGVASFSSLSSALNSAMDSAERLVEDLETYIHNHHLGGRQQLNHGVVSADSPFNIVATTQTAINTPDVAAATNSVAMASISPSIRNNVATVAIGLEIQTDSAVEISPMNPSSSSSRGTNVLRVTDTDNDNGISNEPRRRRRLR
ncbi:hypothetical protein L6164_018038 [Bauhinia variegata]|uniref:Uncharacterized protein n=1 Tax=Bauhinia variegata TaxID=167791 RepID=A0ACB9NAH2_BAUVA|nr:hypothetical protein L6164_018038 [Bauhinia variegata]